LSIGQIAVDLRDLINYLEIDERAHVRLMYSCNQKDDNFVQCEWLVPIEAHVGTSNWDITIVKHASIEGIRLYFHDVRDHHLIEAHTYIDIGDDMDGSRFDNAIIEYTRSIQLDKVRINNDPDIAVIDRIKNLVQNLFLAMYEHPRTDRIRMTR
jgi:hypothetical protein